jgi:hypothetical protein
MTLSRRRLLAALGTAGGAGAVAGTGTAAFLFDGDERFTTALGVGVVDLAVGYEVLTGPNAGAAGTENGRTLSVPLAGLTETTDEGSVLLSISLAELEDAVNNPAAVWFRLACPSPSVLAAQLQVRLSNADCATGAVGGTIDEGPLSEVADRLRNGHLLGPDPAIGAGQCLTDERCLHVEYWLADGYVGHDETSLSIEVVGVQCRNDPAPANPFPARPACETADPCACCRSLGKLELEDGVAPGIGDSYVEPGVYPFTEGGAGYEIEIYDTLEKDGGTETTAVAFRLLRVDGGPQPALCEVGIKAGPGSPLPYEADGSPSNDTASLESGGLLSAPGGKGISHVTVAVCASDCDEEGR